MEKLKVINLAKSYDRDVPVLRDISFCVDDRDFFVLFLDHRAVEKQPS